MARAKDAGALRDDFDITDTPLIQLMLTSVIEYAGDVSPDLWRRYLAIVLDGLRAEAQRTPLGPGALSDDQLDVVMSRGFGRRSGGSSDRPFRAYEAPWTAPPLTSR